MINANKRNGSWQINFRYFDPLTGQRKRFQKNAPNAYNTKRKALQWGMEQLDLLENPPPPTKQNENLTFEEFAHMYLKRAEAFLKPSTFKMRSYRVKGHFIECFGPMKLAMISAFELDAYVAERLKLVKAITVRGELACLSAMFHEAKRWGLIDKVPQFKKPRASKIEWIYLTEDECARFIEACTSEPLLINLVPFVLNTGLRTGEFLGLRWDDIDLKEEVMTIRRSYVDGHTSTPKSGKSRIMPLNQTALQSLIDQKPTSFMRGNLVFCNIDGSQMTKEHLRTPWARAIKRAQLRSFTRHDLRHTFASHLVQRGVSLQVVKELLGHADIATTMIYAHLAPQNLKDGVAALDKIGDRLVTSTQNA